MIMCSNCKKRPAVVFLTSVQGNEKKNEGLCLACARERKIPQVAEYMEKLGITDEEIDQLSDQMMGMLDGDSFESYLELKPFAQLNKKIAAVNQAEIHEVSLMPYLSIFKALVFKTLGDIDNLIKNYSEGAYQIACYQIGVTDLDIISSSIGPQNLCIAYILKNGGGRAGIKMMFDALNGKSPGNEVMADLLIEQSKDLPFMNQ